MKTTVEIPDLLFRRAKKHCADLGISFRELIETGLRAALDEPKSGKRFRLKSFGYAGRGQQEQDWTAIREMIYQGRGGSGQST